MNKTNNYNIIIVLLVIAIVIVGGIVLFRDSLFVKDINATCQATVKDQETLIEVTTDDEIEKYTYNEKYESNEKSYTINERSLINTVKLERGKSNKTVTCENEIIISGSCEAIVDDNTTTINVKTTTPLDKIIYNNQFESKELTYTINNRSLNNSVTLYSGDANKVIDCTKKIKINASCEAKIVNDKTFIKVDTTSPIEKYVYNDKYESKESSITINEASRNNKVTLYSSGANETIECATEVDINATCKAVIKKNETTITVTTSNTNIEKYVYNDKYESKSNKYVIPGQQMSNKVTLHSNGQKKTFVCTNEVVKTNLEIHLFNSGHYDDAILIRTDDKTLFIDGGRIGCQDKVLAYLKEAGVKTIDLLIGSHVEYDHVQVQGPIVDTFTVKEALYSVDINTCNSRGTCESKDQQYVLSALKRHNVKTTVAAVPSVVTVGDLKLYIIGPLSITSNKNNNSLIFIMKYYDNTFMFTGDSYSSFMNVNGLTNNAKKIGLSSIAVDVLKYPHHGNNPMNTTVLNAMKPKMIVVPNALAPQYPSSSNTNLIKNMGIKLYRVSDGNILLLSDGSNINVKMGVKASDYKR